MSRLSITYNTLANSRNEAAIGVLMSVLRESDDAPTREFALRALIQRREPRAADELFKLWSKLSPREISIVARQPDWIESSVLGELHKLSDQTQDAIVAACRFRLFSTIAPLTAIAENCPDRSIRQSATVAVLTLVTPLGKAARDDQGQPSVRRTVLQRLADSVKTVETHRNASLIDAFLAVSSWGDAGLRQTIAANGPMADLLISRMGKTDNKAVLELLAGYICRRKPNEKILQQIQAHKEIAFGSTLLEMIGHEPSGTSIRNLRMTGIPASLENGLTLVASLAPEQRAGLVNIYAYAGDDSQETLTLAVEALKHGGPGVESAVANCFEVSEPLELDFWMRAVEPVAENDEAKLAEDAGARLLKSLIDLLGHPDAAIVRGVHHVLAPLHADTMLPQMKQIRQRSRNQLGRVVAMVDEGALDRVRDALRHPVLSKRLEAITMAESLSFVDELTDSFTRISRDDHQEARIQAAQAMANASSDETMKLLEEMLDLPPSPVRDVATQAVAKRKEKEVAG